MGRTPPVWAVVLAGGEGERLRLLTEERFGRHVPKQYCTFVGSRSMLQHTMARVEALSGFDRCVVVIARHHAEMATRQLLDCPPRQLVLQPGNRDTAAGVFLGAAYVGRHDPDAIVLILPSDHFVHPRARFVAVARGAIEAARTLDRLVLLGVAPDSLELDYGWIAPGRPLGHAGGHAVGAVDEFVEKPNLAAARHLRATGGLWNTMVVAVRLGTLWDLGRRYLSEIMQPFARLLAVLGTAEEDRLLSRLYRTLPSRNFSSGLLQKARDRMAVVTLDDVLWSDWGRPERIERTLNQLGQWSASVEPACHLRAG